MMLSYNFVCMVSFYYCFLLSKMQDTIDNTLNILKHHIIMISKYGNSLLIEVVGPYRIMLISHRGIMDFSIQFYVKFDFRAIKIKDIGSNTMLPSELQSPYLASLQILP